MAGQLLQVAEHGLVDPDGTHHWLIADTTLVTPANRRRILDRNSSEPRDDGWCYQTRQLDDECTAVTRVRWDDPRLYAPADLERALGATVLAALEGTP